MLSATNITKKFDDFTALNDISLTVPDCCIYGLVGVNGAGKSTLIRTMVGIYKADEGTVELNGERVWENPTAKAKIGYVSDEIYFLQGASLERMAAMYQTLYSAFDREKLFRLAKELNLDTKKNINTFSKGMRRQSATILALSTNPSCLFFDETFDGLDPVMRAYMKQLIVSDMNDRGASAVISSHSLRELEDTCDQLALLHKGGIVMESDLETIRTEKFKVQIAFSDPFDESRFEGLKVVKFQKTGSIATMIIAGDREQTVARLTAMNPLILDVLPLSLEEWFTYETAIRGYEFDVRAGLGLSDESNGKGA